MTRQVDRSFVNRPLIVVLNVLRTMVRLKDHHKYNAPCSEEFEKHTIFCASAIERCSRKQPNMVGSQDSWFYAWEASI